tara:strand:- start:190 stop:561 length:372 start_codon:yes stop_codon:yes gene_type:complete
MDKIINKRKIVFLLTILLGVVIGGFGFLTQNFVLLLGTPVIGIQGFLLFVSLCKWNDQKDAAVLIDKIYKKSIIDVPLQSKTTIDFTSFEKKLLAEFDQKLEEVAYDNRRQLFLLKGEIINWK